MYPYIHIFGKIFPSYMLTAAIGFGMVLTVVWWIGRNRNDVDRTHMTHICLAAAGGAVIGAHLLYGLVNMKYLLAAWKDDFSGLTSFQEYLLFLGNIFGGMVFYGGLLGALAGAIWYMKKYKLPLMRYLDIFALCAPLFHAIARIGCFLSGCCYGVESRFGIVFHDSPAPGANGVPRFPVQLLESVLNFMIFIVLMIMYRHGVMKKRLIDVYLILYAVVRFFDEFFRGDLLRGFIGVLSTSQAISLTVILFMSIKLMIDKNTNISGRPHHADF